MGWSSENMKRDGHVNGTGGGGTSQPGLAPPAGPSGASGVGPGKSGNPSTMGSSAHADGLEGDESKDGEDGDDPESRYAIVSHFVSLRPAWLCHTHSSP
jgi:hypothetical protein